MLDIGLDRVYLSLTTFSCPYTPTVYKDPFFNHCFMPACMFWNVLTHVQGMNQGGFQVVSNGAYLI